VFHLALYLLGPPRIELDGEPVQISRRKVVALLAYLAVTGTPHSRDALATLLWPEHNQSRARAYLRRVLSELNRTLGEGILAIDRESSGIDPAAAVWLDVNEYRQQLAACETHGHPAAEVCSDCLAPLEEAITLYEDDFLAGFTLRDSLDFDEWQFFQNENLRDELASALERLMRWHSSQREYDLAITYARRWLALDPLHEPVHRHLMELYAQAGRRAAVERQYQECVQILEAELGAPPADATTALYEQLKTRPKESDDRLFPAALPRHNLPVQATPFIGREAELAKIGKLLDDPDCRLVTLVGSGGSGKTRLALEAAAAQLDTNGYAYADGVFFVSLAPLEDANAIVATIADALGFRFYSGGTPQEQLLSYLRQKNLLLIMDNYEHLLEGVGLVSDIIRTAPQVKILATSRARLNVGGEHRFQVAGMDYPVSTLETVVDATRYSAVELFIQSARRARPDFKLTDDNLSGVLDVCRLVQGMPLAIRLSAAWVEMLTSAGIASQVRASLDLLETERQDVPERQRSMRAAFDHSWKLLNGREREVMQALSVFRGGFTRQAAQQVTSASLNELMRIVNRSLLERDESGHYQMHELLRQYAAEKLHLAPGASEAARDRHCAYYAAALERWAADLKGPRSHIAPAEIDGEMENVRAAWNWAVERGDLERLDRAVEGLSIYYEMRRRPQDGAAACQLAVERLTSVTSDDGLMVLARILAWRNFFSWHEETEFINRLRERSLALLEELESAGHDVRFEEALVLWRALEFEQSMALFRALGDQWMTANVLFSWAGVFLGGGDYNEAKRLADESLALLQELGDQTRIAWVLLIRGWHAYFFSDYREAKQVWQEGLELSKELGDEWGKGAVLHSLGCTAWVAGDGERAKQLLEEALVLQQALGDHRGIADSLHQLANVVLYKGEFEKAESLAQESIATSRAISHRNTIAEGCRALGMARIGLGRYAAARSSLKEGVEIYTELGWGIEPTFQKIWTGRAELHLGRYAQARALGEMCLSEARELGTGREIALSLLLLGDAALVEGAYPKARGRLQESVAVIQQIGYRPELSPALAGLGVAVRGLGQPSRARKYVQEALQTCAEIRVVFPLLRALPAAALLLSDVGEVERAVELYALAARYPLVANSRWFEDVVGKHVTAAAAALPQEVVAAAQERGRARDLWETVEELIEELEYRNGPAY
jgi:predicted ATPase/DNA-binding SARP family transcriptional activator